MHRGVALDAGRDRAGVAARTSSASRSSSRPTPSCSSRSGSPNDALYLELRADEARLAAEGIEAVYRIGDCVAPQLIADAIFDGHRLAREIDCENPAVPLPYVRERPVAAHA